MGLQDGKTIPLDCSNDVLSLFQLRGGVPWVPLGSQDGRLLRAGSPQGSGSSSCLGKCTLFSSLAFLLPRLPPSARAVPCHLSSRGPPASSPVPLPRLYLLPNHSSSLPNIQLPRVLLDPRDALPEACPAPASLPPRPRQVRATERVAHTACP